MVFCISTSRKMIHQNDAPTFTVVFEIGCLSALPQSTYTFHKKMNLVSISAMTRNLPEGCDVIFKKTEFRKIVGPAWWALARFWARQPPDPAARAASAEAEFRNSSLPFTIQSDTELVRRRFTLVLLHPVCRFQRARFFKLFRSPGIDFKGINSINLCSLAGRSYSPIPTQFLAPIDC